MLVPLRPEPRIRTLRIGSTCEQLSRRGRRPGAAGERDVEAGGLRTGAGARVEQALEPGVVAADRVRGQAPLFAEAHPVGVEELAVTLELAPAVGLVADEDVERQAVAAAGEHRAQREVVVLEAPRR